MSRLIIFQTAAFICGFIIDFFVGDPYSIPHPVCFIGNFIAKLDKALRKGRSNKSDFWRGVLTVLLVVAVSTTIPAVILLIAWKISPWIYFIINSIMCAQILAARQLVKESRKVQTELTAGNIEEARYNVSMIVGRDTDVLDEAGICRAAVETVAENASDGVIAPMFWMLFFGATGGFFYKSVNTMDSMLGYKNEKYLYFGRAAAKLDDLVNFIPARLSAWLMIAACLFCKADIKNAIKIFKRDRLRHASPNSAQTESVCAGALGVRLAGDAKYGGVWYKKEYIGDELRKIEPQDITRSGRLMYVAATFMLIIIVVLRISGVVVCF